MADFPLVVLASGRGSNLRALLDAERTGGLGGARILAVASDKPGCAALAMAREAGREAIALSP
jgi:phosphoribosylglycinamide formyltransferase-1